MESHHSTGKEKAPPNGEAFLMEIPMKLCCMQRHRGVQCPDGRVMCCICFDRVKVEELNITEDGTPEDVCRNCA